MSEFISLEGAQKMTFRWQESEIGSQSTFAIKVEKEELLTILNQPGCTGVRNYVALNDNKELTNVVVGVDENGNDMVEGPLLDFCQLCPPNYPPDGSPLIK